MAGRGIVLTLPAWMSASSPSPPVGAAAAVGGANAPRVLTTESRALSGAWSEHRTKDGRVYYFNRETGQSHWEKPDELKTPEERAAALCPWRENTSDSGRKYYYNVRTRESVWTMPQEFREALSRIGKPFPSSSSSPPEPPVVAPKQKKTTTPPPQQQQQQQPKTYASKEEAEQAFRELLAERVESAEWSWDRAAKAIASDPRFGALRTLGEKRQAFTLWADARRKQEREEARRRRVRAREEFMAMLSERAELNEITKTSQWHRIRFTLENDPRFKALESERDREDVFADFIYDFERRERENERNQRYDALRRFRERIAADEKITARTQWRKVKEDYLEDPSFRMLDPFEALSAFEEHVRDLERSEEEARHEAREQARHACRKKRDVFRELLAEQQSKGAIRLGTKWEDFAQTIADDPRLLDITSDPVYFGSTPEELFLDVIDELEDRYADDKRRIKDALSNHGFEFTPSTTYEQFEAAIAGGKDVDKIDPEHLRFFWRNGCAEAASEVAERLERQRKAEERFFELLERKRKHLWRDIPLEQAAKHLDGHSAYDRLTDADRTRLLAQFSSKLPERTPQPPPEPIKKRPREITLPAQPSAKDVTSTTAPEEEERKSKKHHHRHHHHHHSSGGNSGSVPSIPSVNRHHEITTTAAAAMPQTTAPPEEPEEGEVI